ncbi:MAG: futalosine hydrolase [Bacteroidota bacterium]
MKILLVAATTFEIAPLIEALKENERQPYHYSLGGLSIEILITGVGLPLTAFSLGHRLANRRYDWLVQAGVGGALDRSLALGSVVQVVSDCFADLGVEEADGAFTSMHEMGLIPGDEFPFREGRLWLSEDSTPDFLPSVHGVSVSTVHGEEDSIKRFAGKYPFAQVESMEGAAFSYAALQHGIPAMQLRSISNYVERRERANWKLEEAIASLNKTLLDILQTLATANAK